MILFLTRFVDSSFEKGGHRPPTGPRLSKVAVKYSLLRKRRLCYRCGVVTASRRHAKKFKPTRGTNASNLNTSTRSSDTDMLKGRQDAYPTKQLEVFENIPFQFPNLLRFSRRSIRFLILRNWNNRTTINPINDPKFVTAVTSVQYLNCLLYTSPSPRDATLSRMPSSA